MKLRSLLLLFAVFAPLEFAQAAKITMQDGRELVGLLGMCAGVAEDPSQPAKQPGAVDVQPILIVDDGLRRTFVSKRRIREVNEAANPPQERILVRQNAATAGLKIGSVGPILKITPFDDYGRRIFSMQGSPDPINIVQGITEITPVWTKVEGLQGRRPYTPYVWEMRIATSSIPRETLAKIIAQNYQVNDPSARLQAVRLYIQAERYRDARLELEQLVEKFPDKKEFETQLRVLRQLAARRLLDELELRRDAGQHRTVEALLAQFPADDVAGETLQSVREIQRQYDEERARGEQVVALLDENLQALEDRALAERARVARDEIVAEMNYNTLDRMATLLRLADDATLSPGQKLSLGISGWLLGANDASENLIVTLSIYDVRNLVLEYLRERLVGRRRELLDEIKSQEGASPAQIAKLLANMNPPIEDEKKDPKTAGLLQYEIPGIGGDLDPRYYVQLPPEYDPHRLYPTIVTLNGAGTTAEQQIDWFAGAEVEGRRLGQATRFGYIVIAIDWQRENQTSYEYSAREHHAVLGGLRDAMRRFSIDSDRVFLTGHSIGGDAVWDIGLAHPDLWAGVIPIVAVADRYCAHYWENAAQVPLYVVAGEMDGDKISRNARELDRYLRRGFDCTVVEFLGRGHEHFYDEVQRVFDWMNRRRRNFFPKEFDCATLRPWDNYFWWVELDEFPDRSIVHPGSWPPPRGVRASSVSCKIHETSIYVKAGAARATIWLTPELIDFNARVEVSFNNRRLNGREPFIEPDLEVLLEDVRTRGDRQHPFWAKLDWPAQ
ncbi:MAG: hypothetical protein KDA42_04605 [Planctomycetales bacterium]|nr:hypothetical protein [Planctomycetales bacterium]